MKVNEQELLLTIEATLTEFLPLPDALQPVQGRHTGQALSRSGHGDELSLRQAWDLIRDPGFTPTWLVVPLSGGRIVLAARTLTVAQQQAAAQVWQERIAGVLALAWGSGGTHA